MNNITFRIEFRDQKLQDLYGTCVNADDLAIDVVHIINGYTLINTALRRSVVTDRWQIAQDVLDKHLNILNLNVNPEMLENFLKLLHGHQITANSDQLQDIYIFAKKTGYKFSNKILLECSSDNIDKLSHEDKLKILCVNDISDSDIENVLKTMTVDDIAYLSDEINVPKNVLICIIRSIELNNLQIKNIMRMMNIRKALEMQTQCKKQKYIDNNK